MLGMMLHECSLHMNCFDMVSASLSHLDSNVQLYNKNQVVARLMIQEDRTNHPSICLIPKKKNGMNQNVMNDE